MKIEEKLFNQIKKYYDKIDYSIGYPAWHMKYSNTVFFIRPLEWIRSKYSLANGFLQVYTDELSRVVVMQHVKKNAIHDFIKDFFSENNK